MWRRKQEVGIREVTIAFGFIIGLYYWVVGLLQMFWYHTQQIWRWIINLWSRSPHPLHLFVLVYNKHICKLDMSNTCLNSTCIHLYRKAPLYKHIILVFALVEWPVFGVYSGGFCLFVFFFRGHLRNSMGWYLRTIVWFETGFSSMGWELISFLYLHLAKLLKDGRLLWQNRKQLWLWSQVWVESWCII